ncbi:MAG: DUF4162 domain-containing protein, partial [Bacteroidota bacterium]|nr:DUF4162 domain-containing protein [Bacteroidota bacterium]
TIIFSTHRMEQVEEICDKIVLINQGKKILDGTVAQVKKDHKENIFRIGFNGTPPALDNEVFEVAGTSGHDVTVKIRDGYQPLDVLRYLVGKNADLHSFNEVLPSLNDIFIRRVADTQKARQFETKNSLLN